MAWNEPGGNRNNHDPWGGGGRGGKDQGPPDLDEVIKKGMEKLGGVFGGKPGDSGGSSASGGGAGPLWAVVAIIAIAYLGFNSFYTVDEKERAVVLRFGEFHRISPPGLQFKLPLVDRHFKVNVTEVRTTQVRGAMLTEDENIVEGNLSIQYLVKDPRAFLLDVREGEQTLRFATDSALRHVVGSSKMDHVLTDGREVIAEEIQVRLQRYLDFYGTGLEISKVNVESTQPPDEVRAAFDDVIEAREDEQREKNKAEAYKNSQIPEARGFAQRQLEEANAYKEQVIARAEGETQRFTQLLTEYSKAPEVTRERMFIDTLQRVLSNSSKVIVDVEGGNNLLYLPLDKLGLNESVPLSTTTRSGRPQSLDINSVTDQVLQELQSRGFNSSRRGR